MSLSSPYQIGATALKYARTVEKVWGEEYILINTPMYAAKFLHLNYGFQSSLHYHSFKDEWFYVISGVIGLEVGKPQALAGAPSTITRQLSAGDMHRLFPQTPHRFWADSPDGALILEVSTHDDPTDSIRIEESRIRDGFTTTAP